MNAHGRVHKYGDNVDTDVIIPARYLNTASHAELAAHCMEDIDKSFVSKVQPGDIMVAEKNFGCGSSREHAPIAIKASGISCVIASTFARIFTATPSISAWQFWSATRLPVRFRTATRWRSILIPAGSATIPQEKPTRRSRSRRLFRTLLKRAGCSTASKNKAAPYRI